MEWSAIVLPSLAQSVGESQRTLPGAFEMKRREEEAEEEEEWRKLKGMDGNR